jgi:hypothetical protein
MVPSIAVIPREGSFALAFFGRVRKVQGVGFRALIGPRAGRLHCRPEEFRFETDPGSGFGHFAWYH